MSQKSVDYERFLFKNLKQHKNESIECFVKRLRNHADLCKFGAHEVEQRLKEQVIEKCSSDKLRKIAFGANFDLEGLIKTGKILEEAGGGFGGENWRNSLRPSPTVSKTLGCTRCGFTSHFEYEARCPAKKGHACELCGRRGHFARMCRRAPKRSQERNRSRFDSNAARVDASKSRDTTSMANFPESYLEKQTVETQHDPTSNQENTEITKPDTILQLSTYGEIQTSSVNSNRSQKETSVTQSILRVRASSEISSNTENFIESNQVSIISNSDVFHEVKIGGMSTKVLIDLNLPVNVMSKSLFRKLRMGRYSFFSVDIVPLTVGGVEYCGQFSTQVETGKIHHYFNFYVIQDESDFVAITKKSAEMLNIIPPKSS